MQTRDSILRTDQRDCVFYACETTGDFDLTYVSPAIFGLFGYTVEFSLTTKSFWADRIHPEDRNRVFSEIGKLFEAGNHVHSYRFCHANGHYIPVQDKLVLLVGPEGGPKELVGKMIPIASAASAGGIDSTASV